MEDWQEIGTAPKDEMVLVYMPWNGLVRQARFNTNRGRNAGWHVAFINGQATYLTGEQPTHWMKLPEPPAL